jgi:tripartite-type tricarboxylate transporter receptor subunit TctC
MIDRRLFLSRSTTLCIAAALPVWAQSPWPARPIRVVIPYAAGGITDSVGRRLIDQMAQALGQPMVVENKGGAGGAVGMAEVLKAAPDGYTLALTAISPLTLSPHLMKLPYDPAKDVVAVAPMMYSPVYVLATPAFQGKSWEDLIAQAKAQPGTIRFATSGVGSVGHIMLEQIQHQTGAQFVHVPYKGVGQTVNDAVGGHFEIMTGNPWHHQRPDHPGQAARAGHDRPAAHPASPRYPRWQKRPGGGQHHLAVRLCGAGAHRQRRGAAPEQRGPGPAGHARHQEALRSTDNVGLQMSPAEFGNLLQQESRANADIIRKARITL